MWIIMVAIAALAVGIGATAQRQEIRTLRCISRVPRRRGMQPQFLASAACPAKAIVRNGQHKKAYAPSRDLSELDLSLGIRPEIAN